MPATRGAALRESSPHRTKNSSAQKELEPIVRDSSDKVRQFLFVYLLVITYVVAVVLSTTDRQLLLADQGLKLPLVDLSVPLVGFYIAVPYFVLALHFNLLQNASQHHHKLMAWQRSWSGSVPREKLNLLIFDSANLGPTHGFSPWIRQVSSFLFFYTGPAVISLVLWRFADYQSRLALLAHCIALWLDLLFMATAREEMSPDANAPVATSTWRSVLRKVFDAPMRSGPPSSLGWGWFAFLMLISMKVLICIDVFCRPWEDSFVRRYAGVYLKQSESDVPNSLFGLLPRIQIDRTEPVFRPNLAHYKEMAEIIGQPDWRYEFEVRGVALDLRGRSLRYLSMPSQTIPRIWAHDAEMQGADLSFSALTGSVLVDTKLQGANLQMAGMEGTLLVNTNLRGANLASARLSGSHVDRTQLQLATLSGAVLVGALLFDVHFEGAELDGARFDGAVINQIETWAARGTVPPASILSPFRQARPTVQTTAPSSADIALWSRSLPWGDLQRAKHRYLIAASALSPGDLPTRVNLPEALSVDNDASVSTLVSAACLTSDTVSLSPTAVRLLTQYLEMFSHPALPRFRERLKASRDCPEPARMAALPHRFR
jgi:hypothetical protein